MRFWSSKPGSWASQCACLDRRCRIGLRSVVRRDRRAQGKSGKADSPSHAMQLRWIPCHYSFDLFGIFVSRRILKVPDHFVDYAKRSLEVVTYVLSTWKCGDRASPHLGGIFNGVGPDPRQSECIIGLWHIIKEQATSCAR